MWKIPKQIVTPNLEADISRLLSTEILQLLDNVRTKARLLASDE